MSEYLVEMKTWNTGCWYTSAGQRIAACRMNDGTIHFLDVDRHIGGTLRHKMPWPLNRDQVHRAYLANEYDDTWPGIRDADLWAILKDAALRVEPLTE